MGASANRSTYGSWIDPNSVAGNLLYATGANDGRAVHIFTYPQGRLIGSLTGIGTPSAECGDSAGDVFVVDSTYGRIYEFAHGSTTPLVVLNDRGSGPYSCAVDPFSGDLAVTNQFQASVSIFRHARGPVRTYVDTKMDQMLYVTYDGHGNLYADGTAVASQGFRLAELRTGASGFVEVRLNDPPAYTGIIQWDGKYLALSDPANYQGYVIYRISGRKTVSTVTLNYPGPYGTYYIFGKNVLHAYDGVQVYQYPAGGDAIRKLKLMGDNPGYVLVSKGK
ncbi:MAG TPA: hypothetical protein VJP76_03785 [Candidatus Tumulicola sp.]|nr:hypothetical protein [Candidatus Tumulicola sp.]